MRIRRGPAPAQPRAEASGAQETRPRARDAASPRPRCRGPLGRPRWTHVPRPYPPLDHRAEQRRAADVGRERRRPARRERRVLRLQGDPRTPARRGLRLQDRFRQRDRPAPLPARGDEPRASPARRVRRADRGPPQWRAARDPRSLRHQAALLCRARRRRVLRLRGEGAAGARGSGALEPRGGAPGGLPLPAALAHVVRGDLHRSAGPLRDRAARRGQRLPVLGSGVSDRRGAGGRRSFGRGGGRRLPRRARRRRARAPGRRCRGRLLSERRDRLVRGARTRATSHGPADPRLHAHVR